MAPPARSPQQRKQDTLRRLEQDADAWIATADPKTGVPYLVPLSFLWEDGDTMLLSTPGGSPTSQNLQATGLVRIGVGPTRDVIIIEGTVRVLADGELTDEDGEAFAVKTGFDPRKFKSYRYFRVTPLLIQAWREANELDGRELMRGGAWIVPDPERAG